MAANCVQGKWINGICVCKEGYVSEFNNVEVYPKYCTKRYKEVKLVLKGNEIKDFFQYVAIAVRQK